MKMVKEDRKCLRNVKIQHEYSKEICVFNWGSEMWDTRGEGWGQNSKHDKHNLQKSLMGPSGRQKKETIIRQIKRRVSEN